MELMSICDVRMEMERIWDQTGVSIGTDAVWHFPIGVLGVSRCRIWVIHPLVDVKGSAPEGSYIYNSTEWKCKQGIELGRGHFYNTSRNTYGRVSGPSKKALSTVWEIENRKN